MSFNQSLNRIRVRVTSMYEVSLNRSKKGWILAKEKLSQVQPFLSSKLHTTMKMSQEKIQRITLSLKKLQSPSNKVSSKEASFDTAATGKSSQQGLVKPGYEKAVGYWLLGIAALIYLMICFGAYTRLVKLHHTVTGLHPLDVKGKFDSLMKHIEHLWHKRTVEFSLTFLDEFLSTMAERIIGLSFIIPFSYFLFKGVFMPKLRNRCIALMAMQFLQGYLGAWMAANDDGRHDYRNFVSTYRMFVHWNTTIIMFAVLFWNGLSLLRPFYSHGMSDSNRNDMLRTKKAAFIASLIHALNFATGVMVAGVDGSREFNTFPDMDGRIIPQGYLQEKPLFRDLFENVATAQFHHRVLAVSTYLTATYFLVLLRKRSFTFEAKFGIIALFALVNLQLVDGIIVLFTKGHWLPATFHQSNAIWILSVSLFILQSFIKVMPHRPSSEPIQQPEKSEPAANPVDNPSHQKTD